MIKTEGKLFPHLEMIFRGGNISPHQKLFSRGNYFLRPAPSDSHKIYCACSPSHLPSLRNVPWWTKRKRKRNWGNSDLIFSALFSSVDGIIFWSNFTLNSQNWLFSKTLTRVGSLSFLIRWTNKKQCNNFSMSQRKKLTCRNLLSVLNCFNAVFIQRNLQISHTLVQCCWWLDPFSHQFFRRWFIKHRSCCPSSRIRWEY